MINRDAKPGRSRHHLLGLLIVALLLALSQLWDAASDGGAGAAPNSALWSAVWQMFASRPTALLPLVAYFFLSWLTNWLLLVLAAMAFTTLYLTTHRGQPMPWAMFWFSQALWILLLVLWNHRLFGWSKSFPSGDLVLEQSLGPPLLWILTTLAGITLAYGLLHAVRHSRAGRWLIGLGVVLYCMPLLIPQPSLNVRIDSASSPDVIIIGVDSLRTDVLPDRQLQSLGVMSTTRSLWQSMAQFDDTITPQARTFVAYMSLLTGQYPTRHRARFNLFPRDRVDYVHTLPRLLGDAGYYSAMTTDESRFSNIDESFGFDRVASPPAGTTDFAAALLADNIAINLLSRTPLKAWLLPHIYANRAASGSYRPDEFTRRVYDVIQRAPLDKPLFLITHYCLGHWPFLDRHDYGFSAALETQLADTEWRSASAYLQALQLADSQIAAELDDLRRAGRLDNALLILFSDHGEGVGLPRDALHWLNSSPGASTLLTSSGHGATALADNEQRVVFAMQRYVYGKPIWPAGARASAASLIDVAPTVLNAVGVETSTQRFDGISLVAAAEGQPAASDPRMRFVETGLAGLTLATTSPNQFEVASEFASFYRIASDNRLEIKPVHIEANIRRKQRAVYWRHYAISTSPHTDAQDIPRCWQFADFEARTVECLSDVTTNPIADRLSRAVCEHFSGDPGFAELWCRDVAAPDISGHEPNGRAASSDPTL